jgi:hypothetical protein
MFKKSLILKIVGILACLVGILVLFLWVPLVNKILWSDTSWFVDRFGPEAEGGYKTYDKLYEMSYNTIVSDRNNTLAFNVSIGIAFTIVGVVLFLWGRDLKRLQ